MKPCIWSLSSRSGWWFKFLLFQWYFHHRLVGSVCTNAASSSPQSVIPRWCARHRQRFHSCGQWMTWRGRRFRLRGSNLATAGFGMVGDNVDNVEFALWCVLQLSRSSESCRSTMLTLARHFHFLNLVKKESAIQCSASSTLSSPKRDSWLATCARSTFSSLVLTSPLGYFDGNVLGAHSLWSGLTERQTIPTNSARSCSASDSNIHILRLLACAAVAPYIGGLHFA